MFTFLQLFVYKKKLFTIPDSAIKSLLYQSNFFLLSVFNLTTFKNKIPFFSIFWFVSWKQSISIPFFSFSNFFHYSILRRKYIRLLILLSFLPLITIITTTSFWIWKIYGLQKYETNNSFKCAIFHWYPIKIRPLKTFSYLNCYFIHFVDEGRK